MGVIPLNEVGKAIACDASMHVVQIKRVSYMKGEYLDYSGCLRKCAAKAKRVKRLVKI